MTSPTGSNYSTTPRHYPSPEQSNEGDSKVEARHTPQGSSPTAVAVTRKREASRSAPPPSRLPLVVIPPQVYLEGVISQCDEFLDQIYQKMRSQLEASYTTLNQINYQFASVLGDAKDTLRVIQIHPNVGSREEKIKKYASYIIFSNFYYKCILKSQLSFLYFLRTENILSGLDAYSNKKTFPEHEIEMAAFQTKCPDLLNHLNDKVSKAEQNAKSLSQSNTNFKKLIRLAVEQINEMTETLNTIKETLQLSDEEIKSALTNREVERIKTNGGLVMGLSVICKPLSKVHEQMQNYLDPITKIRPSFYNENVEQQKLKALLVGRFIASTARVCSKYFSETPLSTFLKWRPHIVLESTISQISKDQILFDANRSSLKTRVLDCTRGDWDRLSLLLLPPVQRQQV